MRGNRSCDLCSKFRSVTVGNCQNCGSPYCERHAAWVVDRWLCSRCAKREREEAVSQPRT